MSPLVSIIIPTYNGAHLIGETLDSVLTQTYNNWECIVVDDGSADGTFEIVNCYCKNDFRFKLFKRPEGRSKGANACRNYGVELMKGDFVVFMDSDDLLEKECLKLRTDALLSDLSLHCVVFSTQFFSNKMGDIDRIVNRDRVNFDRENCLLEFLAYRFPWTIMSPMWTKEVVLKFKFCEKLQRLQDIDFHIRVLTDSNIKIKRIDKIDSYYRFPEFRKQDSVEFRKKVADSFLKLFEDNYNFIISSKIYVVAFNNFINVMARAYIYKDLNNHNEEVINRFEQLLKIGVFFNIYEKFLFSIQKRIIVNRLYKNKGIGIYRILKYIENYFKKKSL